MCVTASFAVFAWPPFTTVGRVTVLSNSRNSRAPRSQPRSSGHALFSTAFGFLRQPLRWVVEVTLAHGAAQTANEEAALSTARLGMAVLLRRGLGFDQRGTSRFPTRRARRD